MSHWEKDMATKGVVPRGPTFLTETDKSVGDILSLRCRLRLLKRSRGTWRFLSEMTTGVQVGRVQFKREGSNEHRNQFPIQSETGRETAEGQEAVVQHRLLEALTMPSVTHV